jgi:hypothetical protein
LTFNFATSTSPTSNTTNPAYSNLPDKSQISGSWANAQCTGDITNAAAPVATQWAQADADNAFSYASWVFQNDKSSPQIGALSYVPAISNLFHGDPDMNCTISDGNCPAPSYCTDTENPAA